MEDLIRTPRFLSGELTNLCLHQQNPPFPSEQVEEPTLWGAAIQVPQIVQLVCELHQLSPWAAVRCLLHLQPLSLHLGQSLIICYFLHQTPDLGPKVLLHLVKGGVCILHCVMEQGCLETGFH